MQDNLKKYELEHFDPIKQEAFTNIRKFYICTSCNMTVESEIQNGMERAIELPMPLMNTALISGRDKLELTISLSHRNYNRQTSV